jgi:hypothetical protein
MQIIRAGGSERTASIESTASRTTASTPSTVRTTERPLSSCTTPWNSSNSMSSPTLMGWRVWRMIPAVKFAETPRRARNTTTATMSPIAMSGWIEAPRKTSATPSPVRRIT